MRISAPMIVCPIRMRPGESAGAKRHHGNRKELHSDPDRRADDASACRRQNAADTGEGSAANVSKRAEAWHGHAAEAGCLRVVADGVEPASEQCASERQP